jgi:hypothetical protein
MTVRERTLEWLRTFSEWKGCIAYATRCVEQHDALVAALREIAACDDRCYPEHDGCDTMQAIAKAALKAAGEDV